MSNYLTIRRALVTATKKALQPEFGAPVVMISHTNVLEPAESYVVVNILSMTQMGRSVISTAANDSDQVSLMAAYEVQAQFSFIGSESNDMVMCFNHNISSNPWVFQSLGKDKISYLRKSDVRRFPQKRDTQWVEASNIDVTFNFILNNQQEVDVVEAVILQDQISGEIYTVPPNIVIP